MTQQTNGLRFDIYERVHLSEEMTGIKQLESIELVPHIQVLTQGEQAILRGNLLLSGAYLDEQDRTEQALEHLIPVEITLPVNRVQRIDDISVEIENLDVDLLSTRSLNITGVLTLNGLELLSSSSDTWRQTEEEVVFVHTSAAEQAAQAIEAVPDENIPDEEAAETRSAPKSKTKPKAAPKKVVEEEVVEEEVIEEDTFEDQGFPSMEELDPNDLQDHYEEPEQPAAPAHDHLKIGFGAKPQEGNDEAQADAAPKHFDGLKTLLPFGSDSDSRRAQPAAPPAEVQEDEAAATEPNTAWKQRLLQSSGEHQEFRRLRLCIVQKNETLDTIAKRYEITSREIALLNRLAESEVKEGQVVYIPK